MRTRKRIQHLKDHPAVKRLVRLGRRKSRRFERASLLGEARMELLTTLAQEICRNFGPPFLPAGFVAAKISRGYFFLRIGGRDMDIDQMGRLGGTGSSMVARWKITDSREPDDLPMLQYAGDPRKAQQTRKTRP